MDVQRQGKAVFAGIQGGKDNEAEYSFSIDPTKTPKTIDFTLENPAIEAKDRMQFGIYELKDGKLTLCITDGGKKAEDRPKKFDISDDGVLLLKLERQAKK